MMRQKFLVTLSAILLVSSLATAQEIGNFPQTKYGQAGMKFLEIGLSPRAEGLGGAVTGVDLGAASMFYNPAGITNTAGPHGEVFLAQTAWVADVTLNAAAATYVAPWATVGVSMMSVDYGTVDGRRMNADGSISDPFEIDLASSVIGIGVAKAVTNKFQVGVVAKYVVEDLGSTEGAEASIMAFDAGTQYKTGFGNSVLSMSIRNFATRAKHQDDKYDLPLIFRIGVAMDVMDMIAPVDNQGLAVSLDALHPRDRAEEALLGLEYNFMEMLYLRAATRVGRDYTGAEADTPVALSLASAGVGLHYQVSSIDLTLDYSWSNQGDLLGSVNRFGIGVGF